MRGGGEHRSTEAQRGRHSQWGNEREREGKKGKEGEREGSEKLGVCADVDGTTWTGSVSASRYRVTPSVIVGVPSAER